MNTSWLPSISSAAFSLFKEQVNSSLSAQQKKVIAIGLAIFSLITLSYMVCRSFKLAKKANDEKPEKIDVEASWANKSFIEKRTIKQEFMNKAQVEFGADPNAQEYLKYVQVVLEQGILIDPPTHLRRWNLMRGKTEELRPIEDRVRQFFEHEFNLRNQ